MARHSGSLSKATSGIIRKLEMVLQSCLECADMAERLVTQFCAQAGCTEQQQSDVGLAVRESVVNAVLHGNRSQLRKKVFLRAELNRAALHVCVRDQGKGFDPRSIPDPRRPENLMKESGRGILVMQASMDQVNIRRAPSGATEVRMVKFLPKVREEEHKMSLKVNKREVDGVTIVDLEGRIVLGEPTATLRETLQDLVARGQRKVLLNLGGISYVDSSGLGALVSGFTTVTSQQGQLKLLHLTTKVHDLLQITKLLTVFDVYEDESAALKSFR